MSGQSAKESTLDCVHPCSRLVQEVSVAGRSGRCMKRETFEKIWCVKFCGKDVPEKKEIVLYSPGGERCDFELMAEVRIGQGRSWSGR